MNNLTWVINQAVCDILDHYKMWAELTDNELLELIYREFRNSDNWFYGDTKDLDKSEVEEFLNNNKEQKWQ